MTSKGPSLHPPRHMCGVEHVLGEVCSVHLILVWSVDKYGVLPRTHRISFRLSRKRWNIPRTVYRGKNKGHACKHVGKILETATDTHTPCVIANGLLRMYHSSSKLQIARSVSLLEQDIASRCLTH